MGWSVIPKTLHFEALSTVPQNVTLFGNRFIADVISEDEVELVLGGL